MSNRITEPPDVTEEELNALLVESGIFGTEEYLRLLNEAMVEAIVKRVMNDEEAARRVVTELPEARCQVQYYQLAIMKLGLNPIPKRRKNDGGD